MRPAHVHSNVQSDRATGMPRPLSTRPAWRSASRRRACAVPTPWKRCGPCARGPSLPRGEGTFVRAAPGSEVPEQALRRSRMGPVSPQRPAGRPRDVWHEGWNVGPAGSGSSAVRRRAGRRPRTTRSPLRLPLGSVADLSNTPTPQRRSWSDGSPPRSDAAYADLRLTSGRERRSTAPRQSGDPSTEYGLLHIVCKASACGVDHCSRRRGGGCTCGDAKSGLVSARALRAGPGCREPSRPWEARGGPVLTARENRTGGADQGSAT